MHCSTLSCPAFDKELLGRRWGDFSRGNDVYPETRNRMNFEAEILGLEYRVRGRSWFSEPNPCRLVLGEIAVVCTHVCVHVCQTEKL